MYKGKDYSYLLGLPGFSQKSLEIHLSLYKAYVKNTNNLLETFQEIDKNSICFSELKRRFGWEFSGMRLHEYYFDQLGCQPIKKEQGGFIEWIDRCFGSFEQWRQDFIAVAMARGIGWTVLYRDNYTGNMMNCWIEQHDQGGLAGCQPILVMDLWEHAYLCDYGTARKKYIEAFLYNVNWQIVLQRFERVGS